MPHTELCQCQLLPSVLQSSSNNWREHLSCFHMTSFRVGGQGVWGTRTWTTVLLMGHLDVWVYVTQSQHAASNRPPIARIQLRDNRSAASLLHSGGHGSGNRSRQGPEASLSLSTSPSPNTDTVHIHTQWTVPVPASFWPDLDLPLENPAEALCSCILKTQTEE